MEILKYKGFEGSTDVDTERGVCYGRLLFINDLVTYEAESPRDLKHQFELAVDDYLETCQELGREAQRPFHGQFNVRIAPELHREAAIRAAADRVKLNEVVVKAMECYLYGKTEVTNNVHLTVSNSEQLGFATAPSTALRPGAPMTFQRGVARGN